MSISDNYSPDRSLGNGATTQFSGNWKVLSASYFRAALEAVSDGALTPLTMGTDYTLTFDDDGYNITLASAPSSAYYVLRFREVDIDQTNPYRTSKGFQGEVIENSFDKLTAISQDLQDQAGRSLKFQVGSTFSGYNIDNPQDGYGLVWDTANQRLRNTLAPLSDLEGDAEIVADNIASVITVANNIGDIGTVVANISDINALASVAPQIATVASISSQVVDVAANETNINAVAANATNINTVATNMTSVNTVAGSIANVNTVATNIANVNTVATNIAAVNDASTNMAAIISAPAAAADAFTAQGFAWEWSSQAEDVPVNDGTHAGYSAYHWAQKAADSASGSGAGLSVLGVTGNSTAARNDIVAGTDGFVLRRSGNALAFGTLATNGIANSAVTNTKLANMATARIKGRVTGGAGAPEDLTLTQVLDMSGPATGGDILYRGASSWQRLAAGTDGQVLTTKGAAADPEWRTLQFSKSYTSSEQTITSGGLLTLSHGLGGVPKFMTFELVCKTAQHGFEVGDILQLGPAGTATSLDDERAFVCVKDGTGIYIRFGNNLSTFSLLSFSTGLGAPLTNANWRLVVRAYA